jgi:hypothetical protein
MTHKIGRTRNFNSEATNSEAIILNTSTRTTVAPANSNRIALEISNNSNNKSIFLFKQASSITTGRGIKIAPNGIWWMDADNIYLGEVSAIADSGTPEVSYIEY